MGYKRAMTKKGLTQGVGMYWFFHSIMNIHSHVHTKFFTLLFHQTNVQRGRCLLATMFISTIDMHHLLKKYIYI